MADSKEEFYQPPPKKSKSEQCARFIWNSETNEVFGRTAASWLKIIVFYAIFYLVLSIYALSLWKTFESVAIDPKVPKHQLKSSLIGTNPGLGFRPMPSDDFIESTLIWFTRDGNGFLNWTSQLDTFLKPYKQSTTLQGGRRNIHNCTYGEPVPEGKVCRVPLEEMSACNENYYKYDKGSPCVFLKLNKIFNWEPAYYNETSELPKNMPDYLRSHIAKVKSDTPEKMRTVWVSCDGENPADKENIGIVHFFPSRGFPGYYFPFKNTEGYLSPIVAVWFESPKTGVLINIECKAWAGNIDHDRQERRGSVHFELMVD